MHGRSKPHAGFLGYLAMERESVEEKHEYFDGQTLPMTAESLTHNLITTRAASQLRRRLMHRSCSILVNDVRLRIEPANACIYPDIMVVCDAPRFHDGRRDVLTSATLVVEVYSPATEGFDRGGKFAIYRALPELQQYVLIAQDHCCVDVLTRQPEGRWLLEPYVDPDDSARLESVGSALGLRELYEARDDEPLES